MVDRELIAAIVRAYADFAAGDIDTARLPFHPDVEWVEPAEFPQGGAYRGPAAVQRYLEASRKGWKRISSTPLKVLANETRVGVLVGHRGVRATGGGESVVVVLDVFEVRGGRIVRMEAFTDTGLGQG
jgi:ketosteroid isomerase-like protein